MSKREKIYAHEYFVVKTLWKWKNTLHFNLWIQKEHIILSIWFILCI